MSKPWGNIGTWAAEAEREEEEMEAIAAAAPPPDAKTYPSLREAVTAKPKKKKMTLNEFYSSAAGGSGGGARPKGLTPEEMLRLPTGPRERDPEEMQYGRLGGGFSGYGGGGGRTREDSSDGQWGGGRRGYGGGGGFDDDRRGPGNSRVSDFDSMPSRADEADNWATGKKAFVPSMDSGRQSRYGSIGSGGGGGMGGGGSRADEVDNWAAGKKPVAGNPGRSSTFGSGFRNSGPEPDRWARGVGGGDREVETERPRLVLNPPKADAVASEQIQVTNKPSPFGAARPREEILAEKGLDWRKLDTEIETKKSPSSRPTSANSSRPSSAHSVRSEAQQQGTENVVTPVRQKVNPFGDAKPREVLLQERGQDWRKIDRELDRPPRSIERPETEEEKLLREEINQLKEQFQKELSVQENKESAEVPDSDQSSLKDVISQKEKELETLTRDFDDKVRFSPKPFERPGSGAGRTGGFSDNRPSSRSGSIDESRNTEFMDRPRSRGAQDIWSRPGEERRSSYQGSRERPGDERRPQQGSRDRGFSGGKDFDRPRSRDRW